MSQPTGSDPIAIHDPSEWDPMVSGLDHGHLLQSWAWGEVKSRYGWKPDRYVWYEAGTPVAAAQILSRDLPVRGLGERWPVLYSPKGPCLDWSQDALRARVLADLQEIAARSGALFLKVDPDVPAAYGLPGEDATAADSVGARVQRHLREAGWRSADPVQFRSTLLLDLRPSETELLANMKPKTRYNLRLAARHGVTVRPGGEADLDLLYRMYAETSVRDGFVIRPEAYYFDVWSTFRASGLAQPLVAELAGEPIAGLIVFRYGRTAYYLYGMSRLAHREKMPNYALQWEAIRWAREQGCLRYDLWGAPESADEQDPLWGVYRFKVGLGGRAVQWIGAWDFPTRRWLYGLTTRLLPRVMDVLRGRQMARTRALIE